MCALATDRTVDHVTDPGLRQRDLGLERAVMRVMLGAPPAMVAAELGCSVATLMRWVKAQRRKLRRAARENPAPATGDATGSAAPVAAIAYLRGRSSGHSPARERLFAADRQVEPEDPSIVEAAYRAAEFDYSGRRVRPATH
ncbi:MAG: hypothetical protein WDO24_19465 [Pseudomonadota bacterium]